MSDHFSFGMYPPASHTVVHLSDTHLLGGGALLGGRFDVEENFRQTLVAVKAATANPTAIVITGDLTDLGEPDAYRRLKAMLEPVATELGSPLIWVAGNHDERPALRAELLGLDATEEPVTGVWEIDGLRIIALDSSVPGWHHGDLGSEQLQWLAEQLSTPAPMGTILAIHHPPLPSHVPLFGILELQHQAALEKVIAGSDVRAILAGHLHYSAHGTFAGIPVHVASATCYTMNLARPATEVNGMDAAQAFGLVHVYPHTITHTTVPVASAATGDYFTTEWAETMAKMDANARLEAFSRKPDRP